MKRNLGEIMRKFTRLQKILSILICISLIFSFIMLSLRQNSLSNLGYSAWTYIKYGLIDYPLKSLGNGISDFANLWHVYEDNEYLKEELAQQRSYKTLYEDKIEGIISAKDFMMFREKFLKEIDDYKSRMSTIDEELKKIEDIEDNVQNSEEI